MAGSVPETMRSLVAPRKCTPEEYEVQNVPTPTITKPNQVLLRVHAAAQNTGELQTAGGQLKIFLNPEFPLPIGHEGSGVVVAVGSEVRSLKVGDEVYGITVEKPMFREGPAGFTSDYAVAKENLLLRKPPHLSHEEAAALSGLVTTAYQAIRRGLQLRGESSLEGKTVFVPGALSSTGNVVIQVARNVFGASRIVSTVSTAKVGIVEERLGKGMVDQVIDYQRQRVVDVLGRASVDWVVNTQWTSFDQGVAVLKPRTGTYMSLTSLPSKETAREIIGADRFSWWIGALLDVAQLYYKWKFWGMDIKYEMLSGGPHIREDLEKAGEIIALGKVKAVARVVNLDDLDAVRKGCMEVFTGKGGIGKLVVKIAD